ncbi:MAG: L,D-transpeptidase family protein [Anaerolineae bacterium]|nr:L,D-transpeptidase family protein [Anaerolineae bacterium]
MQPKRAPRRADVTQPIAIRPMTVQPRTVAMPQPVRRSPPAPPTRAQPRVPAPPPARVPGAPRRLPAPQPRQRKQPRLVLWLSAIVLIGGILACATFTLGIGLIYANGILPGVSVAGVALGGLSVNEAERALNESWQTITARDSQRAWRINPADLGLTLDARATAERAYQRGRSDLTAALPAILSRSAVEPVITLDATRAEAGLTVLSAQVVQPVVNAGVRLVNGEVQATEAVPGRTLDVGLTLAQLARDVSGALSDGMLELVMQDVQPTVTDATPMLDQARLLLSNFLDVRVFDPVTGDSVYWSAPPELWGNWLSAQPDANSTTGLALSADPTAINAYLSEQSAAAFDTSRYLKLDEAVASVQAAIAAGRTDPVVRVYHHDRQHTVSAGETITSIAWDYGVPYLYIQQANGGLSSVSAGQSITIPSPDNFLPFAVDPDKRIVVNISRQNVKVYENGQVKWDWVASTGIPDSPTWTGIYQIISHESNAYAGNWNLWMPNFMGVYKPIPGADFTNGFHGFPTRGGSQLLWTNSLGTRVTYGCILLSDTNIQQLYAWAGEGVVVEIQP